MESTEARPCGARVAKHLFRVDRYVEEQWLDRCRQEADNSTRRGPIAQPRRLLPAEPSRGKGGKTPGSASSRPPCQRRGGAGTATRWRDGGSLMPRDEKNF